MTRRSSSTRPAVVRPATAHHSTTGLVAVRGLLLVLILWLAACSLNYDGVTEDVSEDIPSIVLYDSDFTIVRTSGSRLEVSAAKIEIFSKLDHQIFTDASFVELDSSGELLNSGTAEQVAYFFDSGDVDLKGSVEFYSGEQEATIFAENITWKEEERTLSSGQTDRIEVIKDSGDRLSGFGLHADMRRRTIELAEEVQGSIIVEEEPEIDPETNGSPETDASPAIDALLETDASPEIDALLETDTSPAADE